MNFTCHLKKENRLIKFACDIIENDVFVNFHQSIVINLLFSNLNVDVIPTDLIPRLENISLFSISFSSEACANLRLDESNDLNFSQKYFSISPRDYCGEYFCIFRLTAKLVWCLRDRSGFTCDELNVYRAIEHFQSELEQMLKIETLKYLHGTLQKLITFRYETCQSKST